MKKNLNTLQLVVSVSALVCLLAGFLNLFTPEINDFLYQKLFYILIGISFALMAPVLTNRNFIYPMYLAALLCVIGVFIPAEHQFSALKTIGLFAGVIISIFNRPKPSRQQ